MNAGVVRSFDPLKVVAVVVSRVAGRVTVHGERADIFSR